jgi:hypothetical protein
MATINRIVVAGSRTVVDYAFFRKRLMKYIESFKGQPIEFVTGRAPNGPDDMIYHFAKWDQEYPLKEFKANWDDLGKRAGFVRNSDMSKYGTHLFCLHDGDSKGTAHMLEVARNEQMAVKLFLVKEPQQNLAEILHYDI